MPGKTEEKPSQHGYLMEAFAEAVADGVRFPYLSLWSWYYYTMDW